ncbi:MAG: hypothetical protein CMQ35_08020 [Gammaproteobacteria bacterium]|nr:hypothetical protein [Gammaproteobacteria bacterium]
MTHTHYQVGWAEWMQAGPNQPLFKSQKYATTQIKPGAREKRKIKVLGLMERYGDIIAFEHNVVRGSITMKSVTR